MKTFFTALSLIVRLIERIRFGNKKIIAGDGKAKRIGTFRRTRSFGEPRRNFCADKNGTQENIFPLHFISLKRLKPYNIIITQKSKHIHRYNLRKKGLRVPETGGGKPNQKK